MVAALGLIGLYEKFFKEMADWTIHYIKTGEIPEDKCFKNIDEKPKAP